MREPVDAAPGRRPAEVGIGTVRAVDGTITVDVESVSGQQFVGRLRQHADGAPLGSCNRASCCW